MAKNDLILLDGIIDDRVANLVPSDKRDEAFEYFVFQQLLKDLDLSSEEIVAGSIDGRQDGGIDGFFILVNGHLLQDAESFVWPKTGAELTACVITCKHHDTFKQASLDNLIASISEIFNFSIEDKDLKGAYSPALLGLRNNLKYAYRRLSPRLNSFAVDVFYASRGDSTAIGNEVRSRAEQIVSVIKDCFGNCRAACVFVGAAELVELSRKAPNYALEIPFVEALAKGERYVVLAKLSDYYRFVSDEGRLRRYLFDSNVRDFMGMNRVNEDIKATLGGPESPDFWWLNNGVTILATAASIVGKSIQVSDIQIVNGLQTTESIFRFFQGREVVEDERCVLIKVIVSRDDAIRDSIIRATNNQTDVELASLHATDKIQRDIEDVFLNSGLYYERRKNFYANMGHSPAEIVTPLYLAAGFVALVLKMPYRSVSLRSKFMRSSEAYNEVFSPKVTLAVWPKIGWIFKKIDLELERLRLQGRATDRFLKGWRYIVGFLLLSESLGKYDFKATDVASFDLKRISSDSVRQVWLFLRGFRADESKHALWNGRDEILRVCREFALDRGLTGYGCLEKKWAVGADSGDVSKIRQPVSEEFLALLKDAVPKQPWKPGSHREVISHLRCSSNQYFSGINRLIEDGVLLRQKDGVLYDKEGNVAGFDEERVDPLTLSLLDPR